ncbi:hypothetical protein GY45DRAFT_1373864 [Cubamyces sp. BRFM 1775]|nr:hypothetical protein GY45DRAFT_1373864 [Cubamyces sp. BRFM 1775]
MVFTRTCLTECRFKEASHHHIPRPPNFIRDRQTVFYNHLPQHTILIHEKGTLANRIGWVIIHPDLYSHVEARVCHLPEVKDLIGVYRALARAAPSYRALIKYNKRTLEPKSEKKKVVQVTNEAYQAVIQAAEKIISMLANPQVAGVLSDLMPLRHQHSTQNWGHVFWPQCLDDYQKPLGADSSDEEEDQDEVRSGSGWSSLSTNPWKVSTPDPEEEAVKWGQSNEKSPPSLVFSRSDSPSSEAESFDLLPELNHLELSTVDELSEEEFHDALEVAARTPSPPPPGSTILTKSTEEPCGRCGLFRGTGQDQFSYINSNGDIFMVPHDSFRISATRIMVVYHF